MKKEFAVVFRGYNGQDLQNVIAEFNQFCKGEHPCYSGRSGTSLVKFDGSKGTRELRIKDKHQRSLYFRTDEHPSLITGASKRAPQPEAPEDFYQGAIEEGSVNYYKEIVD